MSTELQEDLIIREDLESILRVLTNDAQLFAGKTFLISGGCGFLGRYIVGALLAFNKLHPANPCTVIVLDNYITSSRTNLIFDENDPNYTLIEHDVRLPIPDGIHADFLIHAAGLASPYYYQKYPVETIEVAVQGAKNFLEYARLHAIKSMIFFSSSEIYGDPPPQLIPTPESYWGNISCLGPRACYDESKRLGETLCSVYHQRYGIPVKIIRPFNVFGPGGLADKDFRVIPTFISHALSGKKMPVHGKGNQTRTFCYITDAIIGFFKVLLCGRDGEAYNIGHDKDEINMMSLSHTIASMVGPGASAHLIDYPDTYPAGEPQRRCPDLSKARTELDFTPTVNLQEGLSRTIEWYRSV